MSGPTVMEKFTEWVKTPLMVDVQIPRVDPEATIRVQVEHLNAGRPPSGPELPLPATVLPTIPPNEGLGGNQLHESSKLDGHVVVPTEARE